MSSEEALAEALELAEARAQTIRDLMATLNEVRVQHLRTQTTVEELRAELIAVRQAHADLEPLERENDRLRRTVRRRDKRIDTLRGQLHTLRIKNLNEWSRN